MPVSSFVVLLDCLVADPWEPGDGITPTFNLVPLAHSTFPFAPVSQRVTGTDMLLLHHFWFVAVAPFRSTTVTNASYLLLVTF